ncbi:MAG: hypothetical protein M3P43_08410 [Actinomycetota bacterium]|nr:hypothetical protein [Actinomycetota bacterium]
MASPRIGRALHVLLVAPLIVATSCVFGSKSSASGTPTTSSASTSAGGCLLQTDPAVSGIHGNQFAAVAGSGPDNYWAVGTHFEVTKSGPLAQHWDGSSWDTAMAGGKKFHGMQLNDVGALAPNDVWAVGFSYGGASSIHWDGTSWSELPGARGHPGSIFLGLAAVSPTEIWAVGKASGAGGYDVPIIERSDGSSWTTVAAPVPDGIASGLRDVSASGARSQWAVGWTVDNDKVFRPFVERWDGQRWTIVAVPHPDADALLSGVAAVGPDDVWAAGWSWRGDATRSLTLHWDGRTWSRVPLPGRDGETARLATVTATGDHVGVAGQAPDQDGILQPVAFTLSGSTWVDQAVAIEPSGGGFQGLIFLGDQGMVAVGSQLAADGYGSLVQKGC